MWARGRLKRMPPEASACCSYSTWRERFFAVHWVRASPAERSHSFTPLFRKTHLQTPLHWATRSVEALDACNSECVCYWSSTKAGFEATPAMGADNVTINNERDVHMHNTSTYCVSCTILRWENRVRDNTEYTLRTLKFSFFIKSKLHPYDLSLSLCYVCVNFLNYILVNLLNYEYIKFTFILNRFTLKIIDSFKDFVVYANEKFKIPHFAGNPYQLSTQLELHTSHGAEHPLTTGLSGHIQHRFLKHK